MGPPESRNGGDVEMNEVSHKVDVRTRTELEKVLNILWESPEEVSMEDGDKIEDIIRGLLGMGDSNASP